MSVQVRSESADIRVRQHQPDLRLLHELRIAPDWGAVNQIGDRQESSRVRRARRQALLLMFCSSLFSLAVLYGLWMLVGRFA